MKLKKATKILHIIGILILAISLGVFATIGFTSLGPDVDEIGKANGVAAFIFLGIAALGIVFTIMAGRECTEDSPSKKKFIALGILECLFGFLPAGVCAIIRGAKDGI